MRKRNHRFEFCMNDAEKKLFYESVRKTGLTGQAYLLQLISGRVPKEKPPPEYYAMMNELRRIGININQLAHFAHATGSPYAERYDKDAAMLREAIIRITRAVIEPEQETV